MNSIFHRVSIRQYQEKPVEDQQIELMLRAAMAAPSARNGQPWEYYVVTDKDKIEELSQASRYSVCAKSAPLVFVACYRDRGPDSLKYVQMDMGASVENLLLEADELGLGAVWIGIAPTPERMEYVKKAVDRPST